MGVEFASHKLPDKNILEVSLIGTGGGYGECIIIHVSNNQWVVIDSCVNPITKRSVPLEYLVKRGVDISKNVKHIICTHWHDDHIKGLSQLLEFCDSATFSTTPCTDTQKFVRFVKLGDALSKDERILSSTTELSKCLDIIEKKRLRFKKASQDTTLMRIISEEINGSIIALSPSQFILSQFDYEISALMNSSDKLARKIVPESPNDKSVALLIDVNGRKLLLGSDLEVSNNEEKGWLCILDNCECVKQTNSSLFKIPHHGSETGYHQRVWDELLTPKPLSILTPYNKGIKPIPDKTMITKILSHTNNLYITSTNSLSNSPKKRNSKLDIEIKSRNKTLREVKYNLGVVICTVDLADSESKWNTVLEGTASKID